MKINFRNLQKIIVDIILGEIIGVSLCVSELIKINKIKDIGIESRVQSQYEYHENSENHYYNYYFQSNDERKIWITYHVNKKGTKSDEKIYWHKKVKYNPLNPKKYAFIGKDNLVHIFNIYYYFITLPLLLSIFYLFLFPDKLNKKIITIFQNTFIKHTTNKNSNIH